MAVEVDLNHVKKSNIDALKRPGPMNETRKVLQKCPVSECFGERLNRFKFFSYQYLWMSGLFLLIEFQSI